MIPQTPKYKSYVVLDDAEQREVARALREEGDEGAARRFGISKYTLARAAVGCALQAGSALVIRQGLTGR